MKLLEVRQIASERLNVLRQQREKLINMTKENVSVPQNNINFDRIEISKAISDIDKEYEQISDIADKLSIMDANIQNAEISRQQSEAAAEAAEEIMKILEIFRRISKGDKVPPTVNLAAFFILKTFLAVIFNLTLVLSSIVVPTPKEASVPQPVPIIIWGVNEA